MQRFLQYTFLAIIAVILSACASQPQTTDNVTSSGTTQAPTVEAPTQTLVPSPTPEPPRVLTVCMGQEPASLFLYGDISASARGIRQAIYDGPFDIVNGEVQPVILEQIPSLTNGGAELRPVQVEIGDVIMDAHGNWVSLQEGVSYRPSGCTSPNCAQTVQGGDSVTMDELAVRFRIVPEIRWSDGTPVTAGDSVYSYTVARELYGNALEKLRFTESYTALDEQTVEWLGIPGYQGPYATHFFSPLPKHLLGNLPAQELLSSELSARTPVGWGAYMLEEWVPGDHITLRQNPNYYRADEGLPRFDHLVYRFIERGDAAVDALLVGECDYIDQTALTRDEIPRLLEAQNENQAQVQIHPNGALEQAVFGVDSIDPARADLFASEDVRRAVAMCVDRQRMADELLFSVAAVPDGYLPPEHVLYNPEISHYDFDPQAARDLLASVGWVDYDGLAETPLTSVGVPGVPDGTEFKFTYLVPDDPERRAAAQIIQESLAQCSIQAEIQAQEWDALLAPGPEGPVFGRNFEMAQFAWAESQKSACFLYLSQEIPGPYPEYPKGWGGGNPSGYSSSDFDQACQTAMYTLPDADVYRQAHAQAQAIFADDLPALPLYWRLNLEAARLGWCFTPSVGLHTVETFDYGEACEK